jgi:flagellar hook protein FlgE
MAFLRSLFAGVSGLRNHQTMMDVIGNNIANINTVGFKAGRATFSELYAQTLRSGTQPVNGNGGTNPMQVGLGMTVNSIDTIFSQGNIENTGIFSDLAVQGNGFFVVKKDGKDVYTRVGTFQFDSTGTLVNAGTGAIVQGKIADAQGNIPSGTTLQDIKVGLDTMSPAMATTKMKFAGNLNSDAAIGATANASVSVFDSLGNQHTVTITFTKTGPNAWSWGATVPAPATTSASGVVTFNGDGTLNSLTGNPLAITPGGGANAMSVIADFGTPSTTIPGNFAGLTQTAGSSTITPREQDGYAAGALTDISIDAAGKVQGTFKNGQVRTLAQIMMAEFNNPGGLIRVGQNCYDISGNSGTAAIITPGTGSSVVSGALEQSNVDLADEFTRMITAQRGFQANARVITTSDEFLQEVVNLKR